MSDADANRTTIRLAALLEVLELAVALRAMQRGYLQTRDLKTLRELRKAEREFDQRAKAVLDETAKSGYDIGN